MNSIELTKELKSMEAKISDIEILKIKIEIAKVKALEDIYRSI